MRSLVPLLFAFFVAAACGGSSSGSLQGPGSFAPNATNAVRGLNPDGTIEEDFIQVILSNSTPPFICSFADAGIPASAIIQGEVEIFVAFSPTIQPGTYSVTDPNTLFNTDVPAAGFAAVAVSGPTSPPSNQTQETESSVSGTLTLTKVGTEWAGNFTATMAVTGAGQSALSGSFDTSNTCVP